MRKRRNAPLRVRVFLSATGETVLFKSPVPTLVLIAALIVACTVGTEQSNADTPSFEPTRADAISLSDDAWKTALSPEEYRILRMSGTERAFTGKYWNNKKDGVYRCAGCALPLFKSEDKFDSGTGWPSFSRAGAKNRVGTQNDVSLGAVRTEILCNRCGGHLGHVFPDGPEPTGLRYCVNGNALDFEENAKFARAKTTLAPHLTNPKEGTQASTAPPKGQAEAIFAGGCFWCMEKPFDTIKGVSSTLSGYTGGPELSPSYKEVANHRTGHYEAIRIVYDPDVVDYETLLETFWRNIDPTQDNGQFCDRGNQYRSAIFVNTPKERKAAERSKADVASLLDQKIVTEILDAETFWIAEDYHQDFYQKEPERYTRYRLGCGRDAQLLRLWGPQKK